MRCKLDKLASRAKLRLGERGGSNGKHTRTAGEWPSGRREVCNDKAADETAGHVAKNGILHAVVERNRTAESRAWKLVSCVRR